ncbi:MAG: fibronectin type III domain-containing protein [Blautia sp.]|nr:fibronectin type III domain-containing protein [Blautia sp.]
MKKNIRYLRMFLLALLLVTLVQVPVTSTLVKADNIVSKAVSLDGTQSIEYKLAKGTTSQYHKIVIPTDGRLTLKIQSMAPTLYAELFTRDLSTRLSSKEWLGGHSTASPATESFIMSLTAGTYYLRMSNSNNESAAPYKLQASFTTYNSKDTANNSFDKPVTLTLNTTMNASFTRTDPEDWFKVTMTTAADATFKFTSYNNTLQYELYNQSGSKQLKSGTISGGTAASPKSASFTVKGLEAGVYYLHTRNNTAETAGQNKYAVVVNVVSTVVPGAPTNVKSTPVNNYRTLQISWTRSANASRYVVYFRKSTTSKYTTYTTKQADTNQVTFSKLAPGTKYYFKVRAYNTSSRKYSGFSNIVSDYTLKQAAIPTVKKSTSTTVQLNWTKVPKSAGYQISVSTSKDTAKVVGTLGASSLASKVKVTKNKALYYRIRAFRNSNGKKLYAPWSSPRVFTLK